MTTRKNVVLVAIDLAREADPAIATAREHVRRMPGCAVHLLHVISPLAGATGAEASYATAGPNLFDQAVDVSTREIEEVMQTAFAGTPDVFVHVVIGRAGPEIVDHARALEADLVVVGTHGRTGAAHALLGSVAEYVVRHAPCPVLAARTRPLDASRTASPARAVDDAAR